MARTQIYFFFGHKRDNKEGGSYEKDFGLVRERGLESLRIAPLDPKSETSKIRRSLSIGDLRILLIS